MNGIDDDDEAFRAAEEMALIEQGELGGLVQRLTVEHMKSAAPERAADGQEELGEISSLLSSILMDTKSGASKEPKVMKEAPSITRERRRRLLAR